MTRSLIERVQRLQKSVQHVPLSDASEQDASDCARVAFEAEGLPSNDAISIDGKGQAEGEISQADAQLTALGFRLMHHRTGPYWLREIRYDLLTRHGKYRFSHLADADLSSFARLLNVDMVTMPQLRFYDTETTGLGTGAGTFAFIHTVGRFEEDEFCLYQYFVDEFSAEIAVLTAMAEVHFACVEDTCQTENRETDEADLPILVTFNGKSFDWPLLKARRVMYRLAQLTLAGHLDLLHISRRFWRRDLEKVSLVSVEQHALGLERHDDLPGKEAPNRYFQYASSRDVDPLAPVFEHNAMDVCSLVGVLCTIADLFQSTASANSVAEDLALARYYDEWDACNVAEQCYERATQRLQADWRAFWLQSLFLKRQAKWEDAVKVWLEMVERFPRSVQPLIELAKYAEHRQKEYGSAMVWTERAIACHTEMTMNAFAKSVPIPHRAGVKHARLVGDRALDHDDVMVQLNHRLNRVRAKLAQFLRDV